MSLRVEVPAIGPKTARIALVGQAPGAEELLDGEPFTGPAGKELMGQLSRVGLRREDLYITNVVKRKLHNNDIKPLYANASMTEPGAELAEWWEALEEELKEVNPNVVVALGQDALIATTGLDGIGKYRGSIVEGKCGVKVIPTYHSSGILRSYGLRPLVIMDLKKAKRESLYPDIILPKRDFIVAPSLSMVEEYLHRCIEAGIASVDIETVKNTFISCIGFSYDPRHAICIPFMSEEGKWWTPEEYVKVRALINEVLSNPDVRIVGQNFYYDWCWLKRDGYDITNFHFDTMIAMHSAWPQLPKGLDTLASIFTNEPYWKDERKDANGVKDWMQYWRYNCLTGDTKVLMADLLWKELKDIAIDDRLLSFDEEPTVGKTRPFRLARVSKKSISLKKVIKVTLSNGEVIKGTPDHKVIKQKIYNGKRHGLCWTTLGSLKPGDMLKTIGKPWEKDDTFLGGWVSGILDGEGTLASSNGGIKSALPHARVAFSQKKGIVLDTMKWYLDDNGFQIYESEKANAMYVDVQEGLCGTIRALGKYRPLRLMQKFTSQAEQGWGGFQQIPLVEVVSIEDGGVQEVYDITTDTGTFIANGIVAHNCKDVAVTLECMQPLQSELDKNNARSTFEFEMSMTPAFVKQTLRGIRFDRGKRNEWRREVRKKKAEAEEELDMLLPPSWKCTKCEGEGKIGKRIVKTCPECGGSGRHVNAASPKQLQQLIFGGHLGLPKSKTPKNKSTDEDAIIKLAAKHPHPIFQKIIDIRGYGNLLGFLNTGVDSDSRIRTTLGITTYTGRIASSGNPFGTGRNLQNVTRRPKNPKKVSKTLPLRELFLADEGKILYGPDYSKAEAFVIAYESGDPIYIDALENGDIHRKNASVIFEKPEEDVDDDERQLGKRACHGLNYLMGDRTLCEYIIKEMGPEYAITQREAKRFREAYFETYQGLRDFQQRVVEQIKTTRVLTNSFGRTCQFLGRPSGDTLKEAIAFLPQSTVGDLCNRAILRVSEMVPEAEFLLQIHDQLLLQSEDEGLAERIIEAMMIPITAVYTGIEYKVPVDMKIGLDWENLH